MLNPAALHKLPAHRDADNRRTARLLVRATVLRGRAETLAARGEATAPRVNGALGERDLLEAILATVTRIEGRLAER